MPNIHFIPNGKRELTEQLQTHLNPEELNTILTCLETCYLQQKDKGTTLALRIKDLVHRLGVDIETK